MFLVEPPPSQADLHFRVADIPVRIHPYFWLVTVMLGLRQPPQQLFLWIIAVAISIVIHELGHAFTQRYYGGRPRIVLYGLGGLAICGDCNRDTRSQILISLAGPVAGFIFAALILVLMRITGDGLAILVGDHIIHRSGIVEGARGMSLMGLGIYWQKMANPVIYDIAFNFLQINILWGLVNLLPIYPLDGGRIAREVCQFAGARRGIILSLQISVVAALMMATIGLLKWQSIFTALMFGYLAWSSYQTLQSYERSY